MKNFKKALATVLAIITVLSCFGIVAFADEKKNYVVLGDSIAQGYGVYNRKDAAYGRIVADTANYNYVNYGTNGDRSIDLLEKLSNEAIAADIAKADIISLSIGGNDFLQQNLPLLFIRTSKGDFKNIDDITEDLAENFAAIIETIKQLNPDVVIIAQLLYNPRHDMLRDFYGIAVERVNGVINGYLAENPGAYEIIDIDEAISDRIDCIAIDTVHPSAIGNIVIAQKVLEKLYELGLCDITDPVVIHIGIDELPFSSYIAYYLRQLVIRLKACFGVFEAIA